MSASASRITLYAAFAANAAIAIVKLVAAALTHSSALFSEGMHSSEHPRGQSQPASRS